MTWFQRAVRPATIAVTALLIAGFSGPGFADGANSVPFALIDHGGRAVTDTDFHGSYLLIFFGYTQCPDICPTDLAKMAAAVDGLGGFVKLTGFTPKSRYIVDGSSTQIQ